MTQTFVGRKNRYTCKSCGHQFVTVDKDDGTTPFMTECQAKACKELAESEFYHVDQALPATHEWYRANTAEVRGMNANSQWHHQMGGLFLRKASIRMVLRDDVEVKFSETKEMEK